MMATVPFYIVDVFAASRYQGNQLAVFVDLDNRVSEQQMQQMAREINFAETTFIKANQGDGRFLVRIFTPEHEVPFAGHPSLGTSYVIAKFLLDTVPAHVVLALAHSDIVVSFDQPDQPESGLLFMQQAQPEFRELFTHQEMADELGLDQLDESWPVQEVSTGLPYIIIPLKNLAAMNRLTLGYGSFRAFLEKRQKFRANSRSGHSTSLFFFTAETIEPGSHYNTRMMLIENDIVSEDAATGSANGCFLAYLLKHRGGPITATVEQGFQMNRKSYLYLNGGLHDGHYDIRVGGHVKLVATGNWHC
ncbi:PhzF family phenazine biosynthesis protein [Fibrella aquatilis]|uniref:PhzF family phenazine biosynthesis protein n=1 Tax=Fibrella aquatilis TaxID=2817059 RepID=A0A939K287_9BACT|nr:PhzF family phenazine biosynthesis protein [Fibrella aquatilis]MBO0934298.1 PhzF family phenazine biosynthesis protein [Fibrella aquatilis]